MTTPRLLVVDDEPDLRTLYELALLREGYDVETAGSIAEAWSLLQAKPYQLLITDMRLPDGNGIELLRRLEAEGRGEKTIVITAFGSAENAVEALKAGAFDYLTKPVDLKQFRAVVAAGLGRAGPPSGAPPSDQPPSAPATKALNRLVGETPVMRQVRSLVEKVARSMAPVLVSGESGTGKELVARAIHDASPRASGPFVAVNCSAIPETLLEAEFFGYRKGAFTGANDDRDGFFQAANGGTLFLDEIADLPLSMQSKLLRVVQERAVRPVGATAESPIQVRIVSATHRDLGVEVAGGRFRQDLFYRLNVIQIIVPPLRERIGDLGLICADLLERIAREAGVWPPPQLSQDAMALMARHRFPGNVRELENVLHRAVALSGGETIAAADLGFDTDDAPEVEAVLQAGSTSAPSAVANPGVAPGPEVPADLPALPFDLVTYLDAVERRALEYALERHRYNRTAAGASLGLSLRQMRYRMARLGVGTDDAAGDG